jgi:hypothetical protein
VSVGVEHVLVGDPVSAGTGQDHRVHSDQLTLMSIGLGDRLGSPST